MAHQEACQLFIEQEIEKGLSEGRTPYNIGKELAAWVEKLFETVIPHDTLERRAERIKRQQLGTNVPNIVSTHNYSEIQENQEIKTHGGQREGAGRPPKFKVSDGAHVGKNTGENEWYTPESYIDAARNVLGTIELDPASSPDANKKIKAKRFYTLEQDGLKQNWAGKLWMNPPYSSGLIGKFIAKLVQEVRDGKVTQALVLVNNATETKWFAELASVALAFCFPMGRVKFWHPSIEKSTPLQGQCVAYIGQEIDKFIDEFKRFGIICRVEHV